MPLARKMYRGGKVWVEVDDSGELVAERGLVKIRYREDDEREYSAKASEIEEIDEARLARKGEAKAGRRRGGTGAKGDGKGPGPEVLARALVIYTDGACYGNPGPAGIGVLLDWRGQTKEISRYLLQASVSLASPSYTLAMARLTSREGPKISSYLW